MVTLRRAALSDKPALNVSCRVVVERILSMSDACASSQEGVMFWWKMTLFSYEAILSRQSETYVADIERFLAIKRNLETK